MLGFLFPARSKKPHRFSTAPRHSRAQLSLTSLEGRAVPAAPVLMGVSGRAIGDNWIITGQVSDENPGQALIAVTGTVVGQANVETDGSFEFIANHVGSGLAILVATDAEGLSSPQVGVSIVPPIGNQAPYVTFSVAYGAQRSITLTGQVYDENPAGLSVRIGGSATGTVSADASGAFTTTLMATSLGAVTAQVTDALGVTSNLASVTLTNAKPQIVDFDYTITGNVCTIHGRVIDEAPAGLVINFGGTTYGVAGQHAAVGTDGWFELTITLCSNHNLWGTITATVTDWWGLTSDEARITLG